MQELTEYYDRTTKVFTRLENSKPGTDAYDIAAGALSAEAFVLEMKANAVRQFLDGEDTENLLQRLEHVRAKLGRDYPLSLRKFLEQIASDLDVSVNEIPTESTYRRWLAQMAKGTSIRMSDAYESLLERFLERRV